MIYKAGRVYPVSCLSRRSGLPALAAKSVDHVITDPPYEEHVHAKGARLSNAKGGPKVVEMNFSSLSAEEMNAAAVEFVRVAKKWILVFCSLEAVGDWSRALVRNGAHRHPTMVWVKEGASPRFAGHGPAAPVEAIVGCWAGDKKSQWNAGGAQGRYHFSVDRGERRHSCQKPQSLMRALMLDFTVPGDLIVDPYAGGGSTLIAAHALERLAFGYDMDAAMALVAEKALRATRPQLAFAAVEFAGKRRHGRAFGRTPRKEEQLSVFRTAE